MLKKLFQSEDDLLCNNSLFDDLMHCFFHFKKQLKSHLRSKGLRHWIISLLLIIIVLFIGHILNKQNFWINLRYQTYQYFLRDIAREQPHPNRTTLVLINDEDYYNGPFEGRKPLKRDYLAKLIKKLDTANPEVIALDIKLNSRGKDESYYENETKELIDAIKFVSQNRTVVLARSIVPTDPAYKFYKPLPAVYENNDFNKKRVLEGFITLPNDIRRVPVAWHMNDGTKLDSFASAIAGAVDEKCLKKAKANEHDGLPFGKFINPDDFTTYSAGEVLVATDIEELKAIFGFKIVIIGGSWSSDGFGRGPKNDGHFSPVGVIDGAYIHANYVESLLSSGTTPPMRESWSLVIDFLFAVVLTIGLSLLNRLLGKLIFAVLLSVIMIIFSYITWQNFGLYFDFLIPVFLLIGHVLIEKILHE